MPAQDHDASATIDCLGSEDRIGDGNQRERVEETRVNGHTVDIETARRFLCHLDESARSFTFQTFTDCKAQIASGEPDPLARVLHGSLDEPLLIEQLMDLSAQGAGIYVAVQVTDGDGRRNENIVAVRTIFQEADRPDVPIPDLEPSLVVATSPGKFHRYWFIEPSDDFELWRSVQRRMVESFGSDPAAQGLNRVLRVPGFPHQKNPATPFDVRIVHESGMRPYTWAEITAAIEPIPPSSNDAGPFPPGSGIDNEAKVRSALALLDPDTAYEQWLQVGMGLHHADGGGEAGFQLWDAWSQRGNLYRPGETAYRWRSFGRYDGKPVTLATVYRLASTQGWRWPPAEEPAGDDTPDSIENELTAALKQVNDTLAQDIVAGRDILAPSFIVAFAVIQRDRFAQAALFRSAIADRRDEHRVRMGDFDKAVGEALRAQRMPESASDTPQFWDLVGVSNPKPQLMQHSNAAAVLAAWLGPDRVRYDSNLQAWFQYRRGHWQALTDFDFRRRLTPVFDRGTKEVGGYKRSWLADVLELVRSHLPARPWNRDVGLIPFNNGVLCLRTHALLPHAPQYYFDWQLPIDYAPGAECPHIYNWLVQMTSPGGVNVVRAFARAVLTGQNPTNGLQRYLELVGPGGSGKTTLMDLLAKLVGPSCYSTSISLLEQDKFEVWKTLGHRLLLLPDSTDWRGGVEMLKRLTGGDQLPARKMHSQAIHVEPYFQGLVIMTANQPLVSNDQTSGLFRRRITLHFTTVIPVEEQVHQASLMAAELAGFVNWCLAMPEVEAMHYLKQTAAASLDLAASVVQNLLETNSMAAWANEMLVHDPNSCTRVGDYRLYRETVTVDVSNSEQEYDGAPNRVKTRSRDVIQGEHEQLYASYYAWHMRHGQKPRATPLFSSSLVDILRNQFRLPGVCHAQNSRTRQAEIRGVRLRTEDDSALPPLVDVILNRARARMASSTDSQ